MMKSLFFGAALVLATSGMAWAQDAQSSDGPSRDAPAAKDPPARGGGGIRSGNITSTGATVPNPGASQGAGTTDLDRGIQAEDNKIQSGICKGC